MTHTFLVMAHPDDAFVWCGGLILESLKLNEKVSIVSLSKANNEIEKRVNKISADNNIEYVSFRKGNSQENKVCGRLIREAPDLIITHWTNDTHDNHRMSSHIAELAMKEYKLTSYENGRKPSFRVFQCDTYYSMGQDGSPFPGRIVVDISDSFRKKLEILRTIRDKYLSLIEPMVKAQDAFYGGKIGQKFAEAFMESSSLASIGGGLGKMTARNIVGFSPKGLTERGSGSCQTSDNNE